MQIYGVFMKKWILFPYKINVYRVFLIFDKVSV